MQQPINMRIAQKAFRNRSGIWSVIEIVKVRGSTARVLFIALSCLVVGWSISHNRENLLDQASYETYFSQSDLSLLVDKVSAVPTAIGKMAYLVTEEVGWQILCITLGKLLEPAESVRVIVVLLNLGVVISLWREPAALLGILVWILAPVCMACVGCYQIRQGLGFSLFLLLSLRFRSPIAGAGLASLIHTTFAVPFLIICTVESLPALKKLKNARFVIAALSGCVLAALGAYWFPVYGGRRVDSEALVSLELNWRFLAIQYISLGLLAFGLFDSLNRPHLNRILLMSIGTVSFVSISFFIFSPGTDRISYFTYFFLCFLSACGLKTRENDIAVISAMTLLAASVLIGIKSQDYVQLMKSLSR